MLTFKLPTMFRIYSDKAIIMIKQLNNNNYSVRQSKYFLIKTTGVHSRRNNTLRRIINKLNLSKKFLKGIKFYAKPKKE